MRKTTKNRLLSDALCNLQTFIEMVDSGRIDKSKIPALYIEILETLDKAKGLS